MNMMQETIGNEPQVLPQILVMEDETSMAKGLEMVLTEEGYGVDLAMTGQSALDKFSQKSFDLLVADLRLPDMDGMDVIKKVKDRQPETEAIIITGYPSVSTAVNSVKIGVFEYIRKPFTDDEFKGAVQGALKKKKEASMEKLIADTEKGRLIQKQEVIRVLERTSKDVDFWRDLMETGSDALDGYNLSRRAKAAIVSGDLKWIKQNVGELNEEQLTFIYKRLEREAW
ncbi:MAG: response regulator [Desulfobacteraceae bacterium]|nr:MAG: response regulator [Desulfobacteraceae bacterium]